MAIDFYKIRVGMIVYGAHMGLPPSYNRSKIAFVDRDTRVVQIRFFTVSGELGSTSCLFPWREYDVKEWLNFYETKQDVVDMWEHTCDKLCSLRLGENDYDGYNKIKNIYNEAIRNIK